MRTGSSAQPEYECAQYAQADRLFFHCAYSSSCRCVSVPVHRLSFLQEKDNTDPLKKWRGRFHDHPPAFLLGRFGFGKNAKQHDIQRDACQRAEKDKTEDPKRREPSRKKNRRRSDKTAQGILKVGCSHVLASCVGRRIFADEAFRNGRTGHFPHRHDDDKNKQQPYVRGKTHKKHPETKQHRG